VRTPADGARSSTRLRRRVTVRAGWCNPTLDCLANRQLSSDWPGLPPIDIGERRVGQLSEWAVRKGLTVETEGAVAAGAVEMRRNPPCNLQQRGTARPHAGPGAPRPILGLE